MIKDMEMECKTKFSTDVEFSFSFKVIFASARKILALESVVLYNVIRITGGPLDAEGAS